MAKASNVDDKQIANSVDPLEGSIGSIPADDIAAVVDAQVKKVAGVKLAPPAPVVVSDALPDGTIRETNTVYEDRTIHPEVDAEVEYETETVTFESGTVLTNVLGVIE